MRRTFVIGIAAAIIGAIGLWIGAKLGIAFSNTLLGVGSGFIVAMVRQGTPLDRIAGFLVGAGLGTMYSAQRFGFIPGGDSAWGQLVALLFILIVVALVAGVTRDRVRAWSMVLGLVTFAAGYNAVLQASPASLSFSMGSIFISMLAMSAIGFALVVIVEIFPEDHPLFQKKNKDKPVDETPAPAETDLQGVMGDQS